MEQHRQRDRRGSDSGEATSTACRTAEVIPALGTVLVDRYELISEIGRGGCAIVFEAHDLRLDRLVAIKLPLGVMGDASKMGRFSREARIIASIHHPNVTAVLDSGTTDEGLPFLVMERLFGESLRASINRCGFHSVAETISIGLQLLSALDAVHAAGIVHRDVKPDNIVLVARGGCDPLVKLLDFGLCRPAAVTRPGTIGAQEETMTALGAIVGTPEYMAPEQVIGSSALDVRVDIYAVGVVLYEALTGDRAFFSKTLRDILNGVMTKQIRPLRQIRRDVPASLERIIARAMDRRPENRYASATELQEHLIVVREEIAALARARAEEKARRERQLEDQRIPERSGAYAAARATPTAPTSVNVRLPSTGAPFAPTPPRKGTTTVRRDEWELPTTPLKRQRRTPPPPPRRPTDTSEATKIAHVGGYSPPLSRRPLTPPAPPRRYSRTGTEE